MTEKSNMDFIQGIVDDATEVQLQSMIVNCKKFLGGLRDHNEFLENQPLIQILATVRSCAIAEALKRGLNFTI